MDTYDSIKNDLFNEALILNLKECLEAGEITPEEYDYLLPRRDEG